MANESNLQADAALWAGNLAAANVELGEWNEAERFNDEAKRLKAASRTGNLVHNTLNAAQIAQGRGRLDDATRLFGEALAGAGSNPSVRWTAHAGLAGVAVARSKPDEASRHFEAALDTIEKTRSELLKTEYKLSFLTRLIQFYQAYVDALVDQGRVERALEVSDSSRGRVLGERNGLRAAREGERRGIAAGRGAVALGPAVVLAWPYPIVRVGRHRRRACSICVCPRRTRSRRWSGNTRPPFSNALADPLATSGTAGDRLYQLLIEPVLPWVPPGTRVVIAADGALHGINFETLPVPGAKRHYWIEDAEIEVTPALSMLSAAPSLPERAPSLLLFGDPAPRAPEFPALKYAAAEIANVSKHFPADGVATYQGDRASPAAYKTATPDRFTFVHFTAHAAANLESPLDSAVILTGPDAAYKLYARDVAAMPLRAELVTVSACRSAGERAYSGEGLVGFAWAFLRAGAQSSHRRVVGRRRSIHRRADGPSLRAHRRRRDGGARVAQGQTRAARQGRQLRQAVLLGTVPGVYRRSMN